MLNKWQFGGEIVRIREENSDDIGATITIRNGAKRNNALTSNICEMSFVLGKDLYKKNLKTRSKVVFGYRSRRAFRELGKLQW